VNDQVVEPAENVPLDVEEDDFGDDDYADCSDDGTTLVEKVPKAKKPWKQGVLSHLFQAATEDEPEKYDIDFDLPGPEEADSIAGSDGVPSGSDAESDSEYEDYAGPELEGGSQEIAELRDHTQEERQFLGDLQDMVNAELPPNIRLGYYKVREHASIHVRREEFCQTLTALKGNGFISDASIERFWTVSNQGLFASDRLFLVSFS